MTIKMVVKGVRYSLDRPTIQDMGVAFPHRDGKGVSLKFDLYPDDNDFLTEIHVRPADDIMGNLAQVHPKEIPWDLCLVKERQGSYGAYSKWVKCGYAHPHADGKGYTLAFSAVRPARSQILGGYNLAIRAPQPEKCFACGK